MKKLFALILLAGSFIVSNKSQSQDIVKGNLEFLKDVKEIQVAYVYENITVGKDGKEATYIKRKKAEKDAKTPGSGDEWEKSWINDRTVHYQPKFNETFTKYSKRTISEDATTKYLMEVHTKFIEVGYNVGIQSAKAAVNLEIYIYDAADKSKPLCKIMLNDMKGGKGQFATGPRIGDAYAKAGKVLGKLVAKKAK
ncbi:hypothetical protein FHW36_11147 [Chitinophaga polysaccharea]|uniref:Uncharacterized protein n=1 Tax=Chitinophaga polysaccharea TaxID=1293035 RepID=A0A561P6Y3_9BACT|nr:hypothetical protein [Chitinophaga polysaccharea]TWF33857.1 hypothetical protein FHW36_11147 [Chitinophaga polysaccharea]